MTASQVVASLHHTINTHKSDVNWVTFSNGRKLATCSGDKTVRLWDTDNYQELECSPLMGHKYYVHTCTFSPFDTLLATCSTDGKLILWDVKTGSKIAVLQHASQNSIRVCRFSPNSACIITGSDDEMLCLWNVSNKQLIRSFSGHEASVVACCFSPDSNYIVSGSSLGDMRAWDAKYGHGKAIAYIPVGHDLGITCCDFSPTFKGSDLPQGSVHFLLATSGQDDQVKIWDFMATDGETSVSLNIRSTLQGHTGSVTACCFSPNGKLLASSSIDKTVRLWDAATAAPVHVIEGHTRYVTSCAFSCDSLFLASGSNDKSVMIWKIIAQSDLLDKLEDHQAASIDVFTENIAKPLTQWSTEEVCLWLEGIGFPQYVETFRTNHIDGIELCDLTEDTLKSALDISALGHRSKILRCIKAEQKKATVMKNISQITDSSIPDEYLCPITREIMKDPVMVEDGYTYERSAIESWMSRGKGLSPMTNSVLTNKQLTPNRSLKMLIQRFLQGES